MTNPIPTNAEVIHLDWNECFGDLDCPCDGCMVDVPTTADEAHTPMLRRNQTLRIDSQRGLTSTGKAKFAVWFAARPELPLLTEGQQDWLFFECLDNCADVPTTADEFNVDALSAAKATFASLVDTTDYTSIPGA